jgi:hypothetical protein
MSYPKQRRRRRGVLTGVSQEMTSVLRKLGTGNREIHPEIWARWHDIVGPDLAKRTLPRRLAGKTLLLAVSNSAWMHELSYLRTLIVERIAEEVGPNIVRAVRLVLATNMPMRPTLPPAPPPEPLPDTPLPEEIHQAVEKVADPLLKETLRKAAKANLACRQIS